MYSLLVFLFSHCSVVWHSLHVLIPALFLYLLHIHSNLKSDFAETFFLVLVRYVQVAMLNLYLHVLIPALFLYFLQIHSNFKCSFAEPFSLVLVCYVHVATLNLSHPYIRSTTIFLDTQEHWSLMCTEVQTHCLGLNVEF